MQTHIDFLGSSDGDGYTKSRICDKCGKTYPDLFDTIVRIDYAEPGKGKPYEFHLCVTCRKKMVNWVEPSLDQL